MQIQKGLVKYKDRTDIVCTYGLKDDGSQYYFLDENSMPNGNIVASTVLVEAIDPVVVASSVGLIDAEGNVVIPFENRAIKSIADGLLLVERADISTPSVLEAISLRSDPLAATRLVTTPAAIKDNMYLKMGNDGRFVFNDQFSEASVFDINGNNILNNEYFSFIAIKNDILYLCRNTVDSPVLEFSLNTLSYIDEKTNVVEESLDVNSVEVPKEVIDEAMNSETSQKFGAGDITAADFESMSDVMSESSSSADNSTFDLGSSENAPQVNVPSDAVYGYDIQSNVPAEEVIAPVTVTEVPVEGINVATDTQEMQTPIDLGSQKDSVVTEEENSTPFEIIEEKAKPRRVDREIKIDLDDKEDNKVVEIKEEHDEEVEPLVEKEVVNLSQELVPFDFGDNINYEEPPVPLELDIDLSSDDEEKVVEEPSVNVFSLPEEERVSDFKKDLFSIDLEEDDDIFADSKVHADTIVSDNYGASDNFGVSNFNVATTKDTIFDDVAATMSNLIKLNRTQRDKILAYEEKIDQIVVTHKKVVERARTQAKDTEVLKAKLKNYETVVPRLEARIQMLETKLQEQERVINSQLTEIERLKPQVESRKELAKILADAQSFLDQAA